MNDYLKKIMDWDNSIIRGEFEESGIEAILPYRLKYTHNKLFLYGAGNIGCCAIPWLRSHNIEPMFIVDSDMSKKGTFLNNIEIIHKEDLFQRLKPDEKYTALLTAQLNPVENNEIRKFLYLSGIDEVYGFEKKNVYGVSDVDWQLYFLKRREKVQEVYDLLNDSESKETFSEFLRVIFTGDVYRLQQSPSRYKYLGDGLFTKKLDESLVCLGGSTGDSIYYFLDKYPKFDHIFCFEGKKVTADNLKSYLNVIPQEVMDKISIIQKYVSDFSFGDYIALDDVLKGEKISLITMDIEGMELKALNGGKALITEQKPILALSIYHRSEDIFEFISFVKACSEEYKFYLRKYASGPSRPKGEIVLYAIPAGRQA